MARRKAAAPKVERKKVDVEEIHREAQRFEAETQKETLSGLEDAEIDAMEEEVAKEAEVSSMYIDAIMTKLSRLGEPAAPVAET